MARIISPNMCIQRTSNASAIRLASYLDTSRNPLPGMTCQQLGLPLGSSYAAAAKWVLDQHAAGKLAAEPEAPAIGPSAVIG